MPTLSHGSDRKKEELRWLWLSGFLLQRFHSVVSTLLPLPSVHSAPTPQGSSSTAGLRLLLPVITFSGQTPPALEVFSYMFLRDTQCLSQQTALTAKFRGLAELSEECAGLAVTLSFRPRAERVEARKGLPRAEKEKRQGGHTHPPREDVSPTGATEGVARGRVALLESLLMGKGRKREAMSRAMGAAPCNRRTQSVSTRTRQHEQLRATETSLVSSVTFALNLGALGSQQDVGTAEDVKTADSNDKLAGLPVWSSDRDPSVSGLPVLALWTIPEARREAEYLKAD
ncbi:hypothetical protein TREES_T100021820 [Tupaia chinensis]|uniref:Uncharacterized protein n=1 Tax=Tupaia chinensis TaxID=246437 RepID=L9JH88_TUPCH|nr:hypothetical protein TREES_T100021820 [Tupaia chinensis]